jgi:hypothetical protein
MGPVSGGVEKRGRAMIDEVRARMAAHRGAPPRRVRLALDGATLSDYALSSLPWCAQLSIDRVAVARELLARGLLAYHQGVALPEVDLSVPATVISIPAWLDAWIYELARAEGVSLRAAAQGAVLLALESLVDQ